MFMVQDDVSDMAKAKKEDNNNNSKPRPKLGCINVLFVLIGADLLLFFAPGFGLLYSIAPIEDRTAWTMVLIGLILLAVGLRSVFRRA
jgi:hypothetical protein